MSVLFHLLDETVFRKTLENLCKYSTRYIFLNNWNENPFNLKYVLKNKVTLSNLFNAIIRKNNDGQYQKFRDLSEYLDIFQMHGFELVNEHRKGINSLFVFKKKL